MRFEIDNDTTIEIADGGSAEDIVERLMASEGIKVVIDAIADGTFYTRYSSWQDMGDHTAKGIAHVLFSDGVDAVDEHIHELAGDEDSGTRYEEMMAEGEFRTQPHVEEIRDAIVEATDEDEDVVRELLVEALKDRVCDRMDAKDESVPGDIVPDHQRVEVVHFFGLDGLAIDDRYFQHVSNVFSLGTVQPDDRFAALFTALNVPFASFREHVKEAYGVDLAGGPEDEALVKWLTDADYIGSRERAREDAVKRAAEWKGFAPAHDAERPALLKNEDLVTVIEESSGSGLPVFVARVPLKQLLAHDWSLPLEFEQTRGYSAKRTGGFVGIWDPINGSGYLESPEAPVRVPAGIQDWGVSGKRGREVDDTFGIVGSYYYAELKTLPAPEATVEPEPEDEVPSLGM